MSNEFEVRDFRCKNCGAPLEVKNCTKGVVVCPSCKTECFIEGLIKNAEIKEKENINSGIALSADAMKLTNTIVNRLTSTPDAPLDILDNVKVLKEEHICIPSYLYYCNSSATYTYEAGNEREHKNAIDLGDRTRVEKETYIEWTQMSNSVAVSNILIASGNREYANIVAKLYKNLSPNDLIDIEDLEYPYDIDTCSYNLPQSAAFNEYVRPDIEQELEFQANEVLRGKKYRNLKMGGSNIQKDEIVRIFLGVYRITLDYKGTEYVMYISADGNDCICDNVPVDVHRTENIRAKEGDLSGVKNVHKWFMIGAIACIILAFFTMGISLIGTAVFLVFYFKKKKEYNEVTGAIKNQIDEFSNEINGVKQNFLQKCEPLTGLEK